MDKNISLYKIRNEAVMKTLQPTSSVTSAETGSPVVLDSNGNITIPASPLASAIDGILISDIPSGWDENDDYNGSIVALTTGDIAFTIKIASSATISSMHVGTKYAIAQNATSHRWELTDSTTNATATLLGIISSDALDTAYAIVRIDH